MFFSLLCKILLTCDVWTGPNNLLYLCLIAHSIDIEWNLQKRIIAFRVFDHPHTSKTIANIIANIAKEFKIYNKINIIFF